jgi:ATP-dependent Lon protease
MEIINLAGYTPQEKLEIGKRYLLKKAVKANGLTEHELQIGDTCMMDIIRGWSKEAGVREFERQLNNVVRKIATEVVTKEVVAGKKFNITTKQLPKFLGPRRYDSTDIESESQIGLVNGLAWTSVGGELLHIEVATVEGNGKLQITGKLGDVMQESAKTALSFVRSISPRLGVSAEWYTKNDIHIHVPDGATPKDGPSAGVTMVTALTSAIAGIKVLQNVAMTGEVSLRGRVLPIGGLKEKLLAAKHAGIKTVLIPIKNVKDLAEISDEIKEGIEIHPCAHVEEVLRLALDLNQPEKFMQVVGLKVVEGGGGGVTERAVSIEVAN